MVNAWSWAAATLAYAVIPSHCAATTAPKSNLALEDNTVAQKRQLALPTVLYRGSASSPEDIKASGGFVPEQEPGPLTNQTFGLRTLHHGLERSMYATSTRSFGTGLGYSIKSKDNGWIYKIHASPNMIDLDDSKFKLHYKAEEEFPALAGIPYNQIQAWMPMSKSELKEPFTLEHVYEFHDFEKFSAKYPGKNWTANPDYDHKYDSLAPSPGQPQLAGDDANLAKYNNNTLEGYAIEFMQKNGAAVGWDGKFPLSSLKVPVVEKTPTNGNELCAPGPDGKSKYGKDEEDCKKLYTQCTIEDLEATWEEIIKCIKEKSSAPQ